MPTLVAHNKKKIQNFCLLKSLSFLVNYISMMKLMHVKYTEHVIDNY